MTTEPIGASANNWKHVAFIVAHECSEYTFALDEFRSDEEHQMLFVHLVVKRWTSKTLREMLSVFEAFRACVTCPLYAIGKQDDDKWVKFVTLFGFKPLIDEVICLNGESRRLFFHLKDNNNGQPRNRNPD